MYIQVTVLFQSLMVCHPEGILPYTHIFIPSHVSSEGRSLLREVSSARHCSVCLDQLIEYYCPKLLRLIKPSFRGANGWELLRMGAYLGVPAKIVSFFSCKGDCQFW